MTTYIVCIIITMLLSAFFSGMELAFVSSNRLLAEVEREDNGPAGKAIALFYRHPSNFISTMLVGNNIALVVYGILFALIFDTTLFAPLGEGARVAADTIASTIVVLFTGEFLPKTIAKSNPNGMLTTFAPLAWVFYIVLWPVARFATLLSKLMLRLGGVKMAKEREGKEFSKVDLDYLLQSSIEGKADDEIDDEVKIFQNALDFPDTKVRDCMIPRTEIEAVELDQCDTAHLRARFVESGFSKIVVYKADIDHIVGYIHSSEMFRNPDTWREHICTMPYVPETMAASRLMQIFLAQKKSLGVVVDEFGGTSGIVALEDIVEEIFGEIEDEHDTTDYIATRTGEGEYMLSARLEIDRANELLGLDLPESDDYMTVGGLILHEYKSFPKLNETVVIGKFEFKIIKNTMTKIEVVKLTVKE